MNVKPLTRNCPPLSGLFLGGGALLTGDENRRRLHALFPSALAADGSNSVARSNVAASSDHAADEDPASAPSEFDDASDAEASLEAEDPKTNRLLSKNIVDVS